MTFANAPQNQPGHKKEVAREKKMPPKKAPKKKAAKKKKGAEDSQPNFDESFDPVTIPAIEKAGKALRKNGEQRKQINLEKTQLKEKLTKAMEMNVADLPTREDKGETIAYYNLGKGFEAKLRPGKREAEIGKSKRMKDEPE